MCQFKATANSNRSSNKMIQTNPRLSDLEWNGAKVWLATRYSVHTKSETNVERKKQKNKQSLCDLDLSMIIIVDHMKT